MEEEEGKTEEEVVGHCEIRSQGAGTVGGGNV